MYLAFEDEPKRRMSVYSQKYLHKTIYKHKKVSAFELMYREMFEKLNKDVSRYTDDKLLTEIRENKGLEELEKRKCYFVVCNKWLYKTYCKKRFKDTKKKIKDFIQKVSYLIKL